MHGSALAQAGYWRHWPQRPWRLVCAVDVEAQAPPRPAAKQGQRQGRRGAAEQAEGEDAPAEARQEEEAGSGAGAAGHRCGREAARGRQGRPGRAGADRRCSSGGNLPPAIMAKALLYRGIAYRQQKLPAQAIADLTSALWLKGGLGESDRADALRQRTSAYQEAGLRDGGRRGCRGGAQRSALRRRARRRPTRAGARRRPTRRPAQSPAPGRSRAAAGASAMPLRDVRRHSSPLDRRRAGTAAGCARHHGIDRAARGRPGRRAVGARPRTSAWSRNTEVQPGGGRAAPAAAARRRPSPRAGSASRSAWCAARARRRRSPARFGASMPRRWRPASRRSTRPWSATWARSTACGWGRTRLRRTVRPPAPS